MYRLAVWICLKMLREITQGQGFICVDIAWDSATGDKNYRVSASRERDGDLHEYKSEDSWKFAGHILRLWRDS